MSKNSVVKKFDALVSKYGFDQHSLVDMYDLDEETNIIERTLFLISDDHPEHRARRDFETEEGDLTAYGDVVVKCVHLMRWCLACFDSPDAVLAHQQTQRDVLLRKCCLAYEAYWHFNGDFLLRAAMNNTLESGIFHTPFLRNAGTFQHPDLDADLHQQVFRVVSEIANLLFRHNGELPKKKPGLKSWLLATKTTAQGWQLPRQVGKLSLKNMGDLQIIQGGTFNVVLCYDQTSLTLGEIAEIIGGTITVSHQDRTIYSGDFSFAIDLDRNNAYSVTVDYWHAGGCGWLTDILMQQKKTSAIASYFQEVEALMLEACGNFLGIIHPKQRAEIYEHLYLQELSCHRFDSNLFHRLQPEFLSRHLCTTAVNENYLCLEFLPNKVRKEVGVGLAALIGARSGSERDVWGHIFNHTEMPLDALAKAYIQAESSKCYANLPLRLKTMEMLHYTLETDPECLNYTTNPDVFANREEFEAFLEDQMPGLAKLVQTIMATSTFSPRQAYESALATQALTVTSEQLPTFDFSDFGIPA